MTQEIAAAVETLRRSMAADPGYAWAWHCNIAVPITDTTGVSGEVANEAAAFLMFHLFGCDMTQHPLYEGKKPEAQVYAEMRIAAEREEDERMRQEGRL